MPSQTPKTIKHRAFPTYLLWKSLPSKLLVDLKQAKELGIKDETILKLIAIPNQTEFAKEYGVNAQTLSFWNNHIDEKGLLKDARKTWMKKLTSNVVLALYKKAIQEGDAARVKLYMQLAEDFVEETKTTSPEVTALVESIRDLANKK